LRPRLFFTLVGFGVALLAADARAQTPDDPYEGMNRRFYAGAMHVDQRYFRPLVRLYHALTPGLIGRAIHNMITNLGEPVVIINDVLQVRLRAAARDTVRVATNTSLGIGGMVDLAGREGMPHHSNDFGITLGVWGVKPGPYLFVPFLGPSTVRDSVGMGVDVLLNPFTYLRFPGRLTLQYSAAAVGTLDKRLNSQADLETLTADAADPYATLRSVYLQSREAEVRGESAAPVLPPIDEPEAAPPATQEATPPATQSAPGPGAESAPLPTAPKAATTPAQQADASDLDAPMATAFPGDANPTALRQLAAAN
jgi:phospholipid-binding lipoprotein MlaA